MTTDPAGRPPLDAARLAAADPDLLPGLTVEVVDEAASTNALVLDRARSGAAEGLVVVAEHQTAGRGRLDRTWETPARSALTFSLLLRPSAPLRSWPWLPLLAGYAVDKALKAEGFEASVKWPNDVLIGDRKVAGILLEQVETDAGPAAVVGVGLNVGMTAEELPVPEATSLAVAGDVPDRTALLVSVLASLWESYTAWQVGGDLAGMRLAESYAAACATLGRQVRVDLPSGDVLTGTATGIDPSGRLLVDHDGESTAVSAGDVVHVRSE
ncbi:biotin--[acetyl-CoA-carboxylase] ligase [Nocardioides halotolerans]|uniref:biotin--[acetyl-CoA-carboxylase] ligase n=1 Tax=Nocardioides halotolerans TaxID=433660 RepID=UPI00048ABFB0|nr:biotin--[acetyl-CoA-carboxylase] ligase [Nocardioides halotolerans]